MKSFFLLTTALSMSVFLTAQDGFQEKNILKLYSNFEKTATPAIAEKNTKIDQATGLSFREGNPGSGLHFNKTEKNSALRYRFGTPLNSTKEWTIAFWLRPDGRASDPKHYSYLFRTDRSGAWKDGCIMAYFCKWGQLRINRFDLNQKAYETQIGASVFPAGKWTHLALTNKKGLLKIYVNGTESKFTGKAYLESPGREQNFIRVGAIDATPESRFAGTLDELKVFSKALEPDQIRLIMSSKPDDPNQIFPIVQVPFNGRMDCVSSTGAVMPNMSNVAFKPAVIGKGALFTRHGYDRAGRVTISDVQGSNGPEMTCSVFFIPKITDEQLRGIAGSKSGKNSWELLRKGKKLLFRVNRNEVSAEVSWKNDRAVHLAALYSSADKKMRLYLDGKPIAEATISKESLPFSGSSKDGKSLLVLGDTINGDVYSLTQAEGTLDEVRIFNTALSPEMIGKEIARKNDASALQDPLDRWSLPEKAASAQEQKLWATDGAEKQETKERLAITLNALWRFQAVLPGNQPRIEKWHYMAVPGRFAGHENGMTDHIFLMRDKNFKIIPPNGETIDWEGIPGHKVSTSFWERDFSMKPEWKNKRYFITLDDFSQETGRLFINGKFVSEIKGQYPHRIAVDASIFRFDRPNRIQMSLTGASARWTWRGIKGSMALEILPEIYLDHSQIITSVRKKKVEIRTTIVNTGKKKQTLRVQAVIKGDQAPRPFLSPAITLQPGEERSVRFSESWNNPKLWDFQNPNLYICSLQILNGENRMIDEAFPIRFGFREFRIDGKNYRLNEQIVHLFNGDEIPNFSTNREAIRKQIKAMKEYGYNSLRLSFGTINDNMKAAFEAADEEGLLLFVNARGVSGNEYSLWNEAETKTGLEKEMSSMLYAWRNHPSIVMWYLSVNFLGYSLDYHPRKMMDGYLPESKKNQFKIAKEGEKILREYDDSRPFFYQAGGAHGPVLNSNAYFCWWPQAERRTWAEEWRKEGTKPLHIIETSFPYVSSMRGMDKQFGENVSKIKFIHENAARYLGNAAYDGSQKLVNNYVEGSRNGKYFFHVTLATHHFRYFNTYNKLKDYLLRDTIRNWRASGISGICPFGEFALGFSRLDERKNVTPSDFRRFGMNPDVLKSRYQQDCDTTKPLITGLALKDSLAPILVFIGGTPEEPTSEASGYYSGRSIERMLFMINDTRKEQTLDVAVTLNAENGRVLLSKSFRKTLLPGEIVRQKFELTLPDVTKKTHYVLRSSVKSPVNIKDFSTEISVFPAIRPAAQGNVAFWSTPYSEKDLSNAGIRFDKVNRKDSLKGYDLLVIGSRALDSDEFSTWAKKVGLASSKVNILLLEQSADGLEKLGFKSIGNDSRNVFKISDSAFPANLSDRELSNWNGVSTLVQNKPEPSAEEYINIPQQLWRWNTINTVASTPIRRTGKGLTTSHLSCGLDLAYSALLEVKSPKRSTVLCQMELSGRTGKEPAATRLLADMVQKWSIPSKTEKQEPSVLITDPAEAVKLGFATSKIRVREMKPTENGKKVFGDLSRRDLFFAQPLNVTVVSGRGIIPLTEDGAVSMIRKDGKTIYFACFDRKPLDKRLEETKAVSLALSDYWGQHVMLERLEQLFARMSGVFSPDPAESLETPKKADDILSLNGPWYFKQDSKRIGLTEHWQKKTSFEGWNTLTVPGYWEPQIGAYDGIGWYAKTVELPEKMRGRTLLFESKGIDDLDETFVNGVKIGSTGEDTPGYWNAPRKYPIPAALTKSGKLTILIRVNDLRGNGGIPGKTAVIGHNSKENDVQFPYDPDSYPTYHTESAIRW